MSDLSWLNPTPHAIAVYASQPLSPVATQHSLPSGRYSLLGPVFHRLDRTSFAWRTHSITSSAPASRDVGPIVVSDADMRMVLEAIGDHHRGWRMLLRYASSTFVPVSRNCWNMRFLIRSARRGLCAPSVQSVCNLFSVIVGCEVDHDHLRKVPHHGLDGCRSSLSCFHTIEREPFATLQKINPPDIAE